MPSCDGALRGVRADAADRTGYPQADRPMACCRADRAQSPARDFSPGNGLKRRPTKRPGSASGDQASTFSRAAMLVLVIRRVLDIALEHAVLKALSFINRFGDVVKGHDA